MASVPDPANTLLLPGTRLDDRYEVVKLLGEGGMAAVYEVRHLALQSRHALKVPASTLAGDPDYRERFLAEGQIQAQLQHPNIVTVTEIVTRPLPGLVMDLVSGPDLGRYLEDRRALPVDEAIELMGGILAGVGAAHACGVVHRDLKPGNVLLEQREGGRLYPRVTDFGIAKIMETASLSTRKKRTQGPMQLGTYLYMSPEQVQRSPSVDARCDVFALGAILFEMVCGRPAFDGASEFEVMRNVVDGNFEFPPEAPVSQILEACIGRALAVDPEQRFPDCRAFAEALDAIAGPSRMERRRPRTPLPARGPGPAVQPPVLTPPRARRDPEPGPVQKKCPFCAETILSEAIKCRYCGSDLPPRPSGRPESAPPVVQEPRSADGSPLPPGIGRTPQPHPAIRTRVPTRDSNLVFCANCRSYRGESFWHPDHCEIHQKPVAYYFVCDRFTRRH